MYQGYDDTPTIPIQRLWSALKKLENWFLFGGILGVPVSRLRKIESDHENDSNRCKLELLQYWQETSRPSWEKIVRALKATDQLTLAAQIKRKYLLLTDISSDEEGVLRPC